MPSSPLYSLLSTVLVLVCLYSTSTTTTVVQAAKDSNSNCQSWADAGECDKNPGYMLDACADSCQKAAAAQAKLQQDLLKDVHSVYDLQAKDIHGQMIHFSKFRGKVVVLTNVASYCGYTESHYHGLVQLWSTVGSGTSTDFELLAFPCNQFGQQEPGSAQDIERFAYEKGVRFTMMEKVNVNGPDTHPVYVYLKQQAQDAPTNIAWNFATYFVISPEGDVSAHNGVEPMQLKDLVVDMMGKEEL